MSLAELAPGVLVATARTYSTTSTVLLDGHGGAAVIDPAWHPDELAALAAEVAAMGLACALGVATHEHYDHVLWHPGLGAVPRWASAATVGRYAADRGALLSPAAEFLTPELLDLAGRGLLPLPGAALPWSGPEVEVITHDAHAPGHLALLTHGGVLVAGDMLSDIELPMPADDDQTLDRYRGGLEALARAVSRARWLIPGHGTPTAEPRRRLDADRRYLDAIAAGRTIDDPRVALPGMAELHAANLRRAAAG
ncbi:MAG: MBL fold metallo-hydrolase [Actinobacteria bacterium]|nr:MAG: MBL fold metallo-hydrolase [Actinomycetota bacterium]